MIEQQNSVGRDRSLWRKIPLGLWDLEMVQDSNYFWYFLPALRAAPLAIFVPICQAPVALTLHNDLFAHPRQRPFLLSTQLFCPMLVLHD